MNHVRLAAAAVCGASLSLPALRCQAAIVFSTVNVGTLPDTMAPSVVTGISGDGSTLFGYASASGFERAFRWTAVDGIQELGALPGATTSHSHAYASSADGSRLVGFSFNSGGSPNTVRWTNGVIENTQLPANFDLDSISGDGIVIGGSDGTQPIRWTADGGPVPLGLLPGATTSGVTGLNTDGSILAGYAYDAMGTYARAFRWTQGGGLQDLGVPAGRTGSFAFEISADGSTILGGADQNIPYRWTSGGGWEYLGALPGYAEYFVNGISADGNSIIGTTYDQSLPSRTFLWTPGTGMVFLSDFLAANGVDLAGWTIGHPAGITNDGQTIVGNGTFNGEYRLWVVSGVPTPASLAIMLLATAGWASRRRGT